MIQLGLSFSGKCHKRGDIGNSSHLWFCFSGFQVLVVNCSLVMLSEKFQKQLIMVKLHFVLSSVMKSPADPLYHAQDTNLLLCHTQALSITQQPFSLLDLLLEYLRTCVRLTLVSQPNFAIHCLPQLPHFIFNIQALHCHLRALEKDIHKTLFINGIL